MKRILLCLAITVVLILMIPAVMGAMNWPLSDAVAVIGVLSVSAALVALLAPGKGKAQCKVLEVWMSADAEQAGTYNALWSFSLNARVTNTGEVEELLEDVELKVSKGGEIFRTAKAIFGAGPVGLQEGTILPYSLAPGVSIETRGICHLSMKPVEMERLAGATQPPWTVTCTFIFSRSRKKVVQLSVDNPHWS
ncbi:hypothetical protein IMF27_17300 [Pseudomonas sp. PCH199]|uniref:hypothetical protein n=1 Tax=unclassified Pseudomonas TaxID=196821 RepID=UPI000BC4F32C|nr:MULTISPECIES: hypothetical protein [unclassified Pseudomonas]MCW8277203.1 hypothetical protein [Pseudomonas sp. PCH199]PAM82682.1 hypothetical protein CES87_17645 [Pseudomonas sp. ERMR1:02]